MRHVLLDIGMISEDVLMQQAPEHRHEWLRMMVKRFIHHLINENPGLLGEP
jgi:hypothetical protein